MYYGLSYRLQFDNLDGDTINAYIRDTTTANGVSDDHQVVDLDPSDDPVVIGTVDNEEDKFTPILGQKCTLTFLSTAQHNLNTFVENATDQRYLVEVFLAGALVFTGFLSLSDCSESFADPFNPNAVSLEAVDGLGLLKDIPLTDDDGLNPKGKYKIIQYISWCLKKTGVALDIAVVNNLMEEHYVGLPAWNNIYIEAKTFEDSVGVSVSCYDVLKRTLTDECFLTQLKGSWWVRRIDEYSHGDNYIDLYDSDGVYDSTASGTGLQQYSTIARNGTIELVQSAPRVEVRQRRGKVKETFRYESPKEIIDNIDFSRGSIYTPLSMPPEHTYFHVEDWTLYRGLANPDQTVTTYAYIDKRIVDGYEKDRHVVIAHDPTSNTAPHELRSTRFPVQQGDKLTFSVDRKYSAEFDTISLLPITGTLTDTIIAGIRIYGAGGTRLAFNPDINAWGPVSNGFIWTFQAEDTDESEWVNFSMDTTACPYDGEIEIVLYQNPRYINQLDVHFANLRVEYIPKINGSYQKYTGQYHQIDESAGFREVREEEVFISDSPKRAFKGALLRNVSGVYLLAGRWYDGNVPSLRNSPPEEALFPIGFVQIYEIYNQYNRPFRSLDATLRGFGGELPTPVYAYKINYASPHTSNKIFRLLHYELHLKTTEWTGYFAEHYDINIYHSYPLAGWTFKYEEQR